MKRILMTALAAISVSACTRSPEAQAVESNSDLEVAYENDVKDELRSDGLAKVASVPVPRANSVAISPKKHENVDRDGVPTPVGGLDIIRLFQGNSVPLYTPSASQLRMIKPLSSVSGRNRSKFLADVALGVNFGGRYRIIEMPENEEQSVLYIVDYKTMMGRRLENFGGRISDNFFYTKNSLGLLEAYTEYPSAKCVVVGWVFNEQTGKFGSIGTREISDNPSCQIAEMIK
jgi:hypothetical protein